MAGRGSCRCETTGAGTGGGGCAGDGCGAATGGGVTRPHSRRAAEYAVRARSNRATLRNESPSLSSPSPAASWASVAPAAFEARRASSAADRCCVVRTRSGSLAVTVGGLGRRSACAVGDTDAWLDGLSTAGVCAAAAAVPATDESSEGGAARRWSALEGTRPSRNSTTSRSTTSATPAAPTSSSRIQRIPCRGDSAGTAPDGRPESWVASVGVEPETGVAIESSACRMSAALAGRSAACFSRQRITSAASAAGMLGRSRCTDSGISVTCAASVACADRP